MSTSSLQSWLDDLSLAEYYDTFSQSGFTSPKTLVSIMDREQLKAMGVAKMGHLNRLFRAIEKLRSDSEGSQDNSMASSVSVSVENHGSVALKSATAPGPSQSPPPIPKRKSIRHSTSASSTLPVGTAPPTRSAGPPPPVRPRDQSLQRTTKASTMSAGSLLTPSSRSFSDPSEAPIAASTNGLLEADKPSPTKAKVPGSPTPKPRSKIPPQPAPRKKSGSATPLSSSTSNLTDSNARGEVPSKSYKTLPAQARIREPSTDQDHRTSSSSLSPPLPADDNLSSSGSEKSPSRSDAPFTSHSVDDASSLFALESVDISDGEGETKMLTSNSPATFPVVPSKEEASSLPLMEGPPLPPKRNGPSSAHTLPALPPKDVGPPSFAPPPLLPERRYFKESSDQVSSSPLPGKSDHPPPSSHPQPPPTFERRLTPEQRTMPLNPPLPPPRSSTLPVSAMPDPEGQARLEMNHHDVIPATETGAHSGGYPQPNYPPTLSPSPPAEDPPEPPEYSDSEEEEEGTHLISIQSIKTPGNDKLVMMRPDTEESSSGTTPFDSPAHINTLIRQQQVSGSSFQSCDDDIIVMGDFPGENPEEEADPDYMNQDAIDEVNEDEMSDDDDIECENRKHTRVSPKRIVSQKSDFDDEIIGVDAGNLDPDYMNQETIDEMGMQDAENSDYMNQETIDKMDAQDDGGNDDYMNQVVIDQTVEEAERAIEYMNQTIIDLVHSEIKMQDNEGGNGAALAMRVPISDNNNYDTEDDLTDDFDSEDDRIDGPITSMHREPLQIRGTVTRSRVPDFGDSNQDYENDDVVQDVLEGEIIPMVVAPPSSLPFPLNQHSTAVETHGWNESTVRQPLEPKTQAEASNNGLSVTHDSWKGSSENRASWCSDNIEQESSLDFVCTRPVDKTRSGTTDGHFSSSSQKSPGSPTKARSHTEASPIKSRPHPLSFTTQANNSGGSAQLPYQQQLSSLEKDGFGGDPFHRDYIPPVLPKSAGTFGGSQYQKPDYRKMRSNDDQLISNRNSVFADQFSGSLTESTMLPGFSRLGSSLIPENVPKTKEGFLHKKGGRRNERPWQKRWVVFNGSELKYFKQKQDKDNLCLNTVELEKMIDVKRVTDEVDRQFRFDLVVINRVFQFFSESLEECQQWVNVLHVAITKFKPQEHEHKEGGSMHQPDKQGYLQKQGHGPFSSKFKERYVALKGPRFAYYETQEDFKQGRPIHTLDMCLCTVRPDMSSKLPRFMIITNNQKHYYFQASTDMDRNQWVESLTNAILTGLETRPETLPRGGSKTNDSQFILQALQENPSNKVCADCAAADPEWAVINRGIMICIKCSGIHRSFGVHLSKVRSIELDKEIWTNQEQINLIVEIGNANSNLFWEHHYQGDRLPSGVESEIREEFIRAKYVTRSWIPRDVNGDKEALGEMLCENVASGDLMKTIKLIALGANPCHLLNGVDDPERSSPLAIARCNNQPLQAKLLEINGASICRKDDAQSFTVISKKGHLYKTGTDRSGWKKRFCSLDQFKGFQYFKTETDTELQGYIRVEEMLSVAKSEDEGSRDPKYRHCFEVNTKGRGYLFCADTAEELESWVDTFKQIISIDAAENLGYDKVGYLKKKDPHSVTGWRRLWFTLKGKSLACYKKEREEVDEIDLRKVVELKGPDSTEVCVIQIITEDKTHHLKAESPAEAESWLSALRHTQVSGIPLGEQQLTSTGIPIVIHKCLQFIESIGLDIEGLYRISGVKAKIRKLILAFNQDARGVVIDPEKYTVHDVTGALKQFLHSLPDPVLTQSLYQTFIATMQSDHEAQMYQIKSLIEQLPPVNRETLKRIIGHLKRVTENESKNKMSLSNITRLFGPTLMTTDDAPLSFANTQYEYACIHSMIKFYKWLFQVAEDENRQDEAIEEAKMKIKELEEAAQKKRAEKKTSNITSTTDFLTTVYIGGKLGDTYNMHINGVSTVQGVVEEVVAKKGLPQDNYALYLVLGDSESHRVLCFSEKLIAVLCSVGTEHYLCLQRNSFWETLEPHFGMLLTGETVMLHVKEKKRWRKCPCCLRDNQFIQFKDAKCHNEAYKLGMHELDIFVGIQQSRIDIKNPMPTRHSFWIKATRGDDLSRYFCADSKDDMLKLIAAIVQAKFPSCLKTPILPKSFSPPPSYSQLLALDTDRPVNTSPH